MLSIQKSKSADGAIKYFSEEMSRGDYFTARGELPGQWHGKAAVALGLSGEVTREQFAALAYNLHPVTGEQLNARMVENRVPGFDFTFGAPKSFTLLYSHLLVNGRDDEAGALLAVFHEAVSETMALVEENMQVRVQKDGKDFNRTTGNMVWAGFTHFQGRPVEDVPETMAEHGEWHDAYADPFLHKHCYVFNTTHDKEHSGKTKWKSGEFEQMHFDRVYYQAVFFDRLASKLHDRGHATERQSVSFEFTGLSRETIDKFSRRTQEVKRDAEGKGITSARGKRELAKITRREKDEGVSPEETLKRFYARLTDDERETLDRIASGDFRPPSGGGTSSTEALDHAVRHSFENRSVVNEKRLVAEALMHSLGTGNSYTIHEALKARTDTLIGTDKNDQAIVTTYEAVDNDSYIKRFVAPSYQMPSFAEQRAHRGLGEYEFTREWLSDEQKSVVRHVLLSTARVIAVRGGAGTGKTTTMQETAEAITEATGYAVVAVAPTGRASHGTLREDGFAEADTLARLLVDPKMQEKARGGIIYVDEAGLIGSKTMRKLFELSDRIGARVILQGDTRQHASVEAGDALRFLEERAALKFGELKEVRRQQDPAYRAAVETIAAGRIGEGFQKLDALGAIHEVDGEKLPARIASAYLEMLDSAPQGEARTKTAHIIATRHVEAEPITRQVREGLKARGKLGEERELERLTASNWTAAQRAAAYNYKPGQVVEFLQNAEGHAKGERLTVLDVKNGNVLAVQQVGKNAFLHTVPLEHAARFQVYERRALPVAVGDSVRITKGGKDVRGKRLNTGEVYEVQGFHADGGLLLGKNSGEVTRKLDTSKALHLAHGYVSTSHAAQGGTVNHVFLAQGADSYAASSREQFYVSVSRGRLSVNIFTDSEAELERAIQRSGARLFASDVEDKRIKAKLPDAPKPPRAVPAPVAGEPAKLRKTSGVLATFKAFFAESIELIDSLFEKKRSAERYAVAANDDTPELPSTSITNAEVKRLRQQEYGRGR